MVEGQCCLVIIGTAVSFFMTAFAPNAFFLFFSRASRWINSRKYSRCFRSYFRFNQTEERAKAFGLIGSALNFGFVFGPAIAAFTLTLGQAVPFIIAGVITTIAAILTALYLPETNKHMEKYKKETFLIFQNVAYII